MSIERRLIDILQASPALAGVLIRYGYIPRDDEKAPPAFPYLVLERTGSEFVEVTCGVFTNGYFVDLALTAFAKNCDDARALADTAWITLANSSEAPSIQSATDNYDPDSRAWSVTQLYRVWDDAPSVA